MFMMHFVVAAAAAAAAAAALLSHLSLFFRAAHADFFDTTIFSTFRFGLLFLHKNNNIIIIIINNTSISN